MRPNTPPEESEWIDTYLNNQLTASGKLEFEAEMACDPALQTEVDIRRLLHDVIDEYNLQAEIAAIHAEMMEEEEEVQLTETRVIPMPVSRPVPGEHSLREQLLPVERPLWWKRAASIAAAAGGIWMGYLSFTPITSHDGVSHIMRGAKAKQEQPSSFCYDNYYLGQEHLSNKRPGEAIPHFEQVTDCEVRPYFKDASKWFLAVACLQAGQTDRATTLLNEIRQAADFQYPVTTVDLWKMEWQLRLARLTH
ncbi:MAG: hypothetical protein LH606_20545 [Cytophagaceae bacterium]|nr:hypothetical protein [Cytophagaceae bacterium]